MKNLPFVFALLLFSCAQNEEEKLRIDGMQQESHELNSSSSSPFINEVIGYDDGGQFTSITESEYVGFIKSLLNLSSGATVSNFSFVSFYDSESSSTFYLLKSSAVDGSQHISIGQPLSMNTDGSYSLMKSTCTCSGVNCPGVQCIVDDDVTYCDCTACVDGTCTKTHTVHSDIASYFIGS